MTDAALLTFAADFRRGLLGRRSSRLMCAVVSGPLQGALSFAGVETALERSEPPDEFGVWEHLYLRLPDGRVLDPTADQFNGVLPEPLPPVYLGSPLPMHSSSPSLARRRPHDG